MVQKRKLFVSKLRLFSTSAWQETEELVVGHHAYLVKITQLVTLKGNSPKSDQIGTASSWNTYIYIYTVAVMPFRNWHWYIHQHHVPTTLLDDGPITQILRFKIFSLFGGATFCWTLEWGKLDFQTRHKDAYTFICMCMHMHFLVSFDSICVYIFIYIRQTRMLPMPATMGSKAYMGIPYYRYYWWWLFVGSGSIPSCIFKCMHNVTIW